MLHSLNILLTVRYVKPLMGLMEKFTIKITIAFVVTILNEIFKSISGIFVTDIHLITSLLFLVSVDFISGIYAAYRQNIKIQSIGFRTTVIKIIEYFVFLGVLTVLSNLHVSLNWIQTWAYIFICVTEVKSIGENIFLDNTTTRKAFIMFWKLLKKKNNIDV